MKNVLVIGGSGFVGKAVVRSLQKNGAHVAVLNRGSRSVAGTQLTADRKQRFYCPRSPGLHKTWRPHARSHAGGGTTLVEALASGREAVGVDVSTLPSSLPA
jgi:nucleoside-diphosphate-sugar epimerase